MRRKNNGFTLVELIVILVILAILMVIMVPALSGWIRKAREKQYMLECRSCVMAAQSLVVEEYGRGTAGEWTAAAMEGDRRSAIKELAKVDDAAEITEDTYSDAMQVIRLVYTKKGQTVTYENGVYTFGEGTGGESGESGAGGGQETPPASPDTALGIDDNGLFTGVQPALTTVKKIMQEANVEKKGNGLAGVKDDDEGVLTAIRNALPIAESVQDFTINQATYYENPKVNPNETVQSAIGMSVTVNEEKYLLIFYENVDGSTSMYQVTQKNSLDNDFLTKGYDELKKTIDKENQKADDDEKKVITQLQ